MEEVIKLPWVEGTPDPDGVYRNGWYCELWFQPIGGVMELVGLEIRSVRDPDGEEAGSPWNLNVGAVRPKSAEPDAPLVQLPPRALTKTILRELDLAGIVANAKRVSGDYTAGLAKRRPALKQELRRRVKEWTANKRPQRGGEPALPDEHYRKVAEVYNAEVAANGYLAKPLRAVMRHFGVSKSKATTWVSRARQRGFIDPALRRGLHAGWKEENR